MAARVELREISNEEGNRLLRIVRRSSGSVVTWRRAQIVLLAAQRMPAPRIAEVVFSDPDRVREVIHNFNRDGFDALYPRYRGGRPRTFTQPQPGGKAWAPRARPRRIRATYTRPHGVRHLLCALDIGDDLFTAEIEERKTRIEFLAFCDQIRAGYPAETRLAFVLDNFSVH